MAISTYGVSLKYGADSPSKELVIKSYPEIMAKRSALETTTLSDDAKTYIPGIRETPDSFEFTANYDAAVFAEINALDAVQKCSLTFSDGSGFTWDGYISASTTDGDVDAVVEMTIAITPTSVPTFAAGA
ncbi:phage tail tube protein [Succinimonas sp.]|uniref:phage tail tube protein n=1 Tax=Succinimonas sp. TaxID=1936151 RepID=UPI0038680E76